MYLLTLNGKKLIYKSLDGLFENLEYNLKIKKNMLKALEDDHFTPKINLN